jgi:ergothioneine biosynthesis protein EgtB
VNAHRTAESFELAALPLVQRYVEVRELTEQLCAPLSPEDQMLQSCPEASPAKWHRAHTTWFFETFVLEPYAGGYKPFHPDFRFLFNSYYVNVGERPVRSHRGLFSRPGAAEVAEYRAYVDRHMAQLLENSDLETAHGSSLRDLVELGLNHEQQHQELIVTDIQHALWTNPLRPAYRRAKVAGARAEAPALRWIDFDGGKYTVGHAGKGFCFDNETPTHEVLLQPFQLASRLVTCGEYLQFIEAGGYTTPTLWLSDGWDTVAQNRWQAPLYWEQRDGKWRRFTLDGVRDIDPAEPVTHVSFYEADAYARWARARLATEFEWEAAARTHPESRSGSQRRTGAFLEDGSFAPHAAASESLSQMLGDCWEWTASAYLPYPGYRPLEGALGEYNGKFMCNQMVLRGGSCATPRSHIRASYRNFFPPQTRWQFSGIRLAHDRS